MSDIRIGHGHDVHRFEKGRKCIIGGVDIPSGPGLLGHSDAAGLPPAVAGALLGAAALGDIGKHFPDTSPEFEGADSLVLLRNTVELIGKKGYIVSNIDSTVIAQMPKLAPYIDDMRKNISAVCGIEKDRVSVKATTEEKLGFTGAKQGISAHAVCIIEKA